MSAKKTVRRTSKRKITRHHRRPRFFNGEPHKDILPIPRSHNFSMVPKHQHEAFHTLFAWAYPAKMVCQILNAKWLCSSEMVIPIPTGEIPRVLKYLESIGIVISETDIGVTHIHRERMPT